jgi:hypothetical protein
MAYLYRHIRLDLDQPFYIGVGLSNDTLYRRAYNSKNRNNYWKNIVNKTNYEVEIILEDLTNEEAFKKEIEFIKIYGKKSNGGILCNIADGGNGGFLGKDVNILRSIALKGHKLSVETKDKIRKKAKGRKASAETKIKMSKTHKDKKTGHWLKSVGHYNGRAKKVYQFDISNNFIKEWECGSYASKELGINKSCISEAIKGNQKTAGGYIWKFYK